MKKNNFSLHDISYKFLSVTFMIFAFCALFAALIGAKWSAGYYNNNFGAVILYFSTFTVVSCLFYLLLNKTPKDKYKFIISAVFLITFIKRIVTVLIINVKPASDFLFYQNCSEIINKGELINSNYASAFPHTIGFSAVISVIYKIFGNNLINVQIFNVICSLLTAFVLYKLTIKLLDRKTGILTAFIFCIFPSGILYNELIATEPLFTLLFMLVIYLTALLNEKFKIIYIVLISLTVSALNMVRPCGLVIMLALSILIFFILREKLCKKLIFVVCLLTLVTLGNQLSALGLSKINGLPVTTSPFGYSFYVGSNTSTHGAWNAPDAAFADTLLYDPEINADEFHKKLLSEGLNRYISNGFYENSKLFITKFGFLWGTDILVDFYLSSDPNFNYALEAYKLGSLGNAFHVFLLLFIFIGGLTVLKGKNRKNGILFIFILVLGITAQHVLAEIMERYVYSATVAMFPVAALGITTIFKGRKIMFKRLREDINAALERDPAAKNGFEVFFLSTGIHALMWHRLAHKLYKCKLIFISKIVSQLTRFFTGIEIHPGAKIGHGVLIDHGMGVVIGETAEVGDNCTIYQNVTLGGTGKDTGKRHPTIGSNVLIGAGAKVLGPFSVGDNSKIAANAVVLSEVPENSTCVGVPARVVIKDNVKVKNWQLDHTHIPDPVSQELCKLLIRIERLEKKGEKTE